MDLIIEVLENKLRLIRRKKEILEQLAGTPREPFCSALKKDFVKTEELIFQADEVFIGRYNEYRKRLPLKVNGEIDVAKLKDGDRVILKKIRELVRQITKEQ